MVLFSKNKQAVCCGLKRLNIWGVIVRGFCIFIHDKGRLKTLPVLSDGLRAGCWQGGWKAAADFDAGD
ncbi:hypothetical protein BWD08_04675 [Neisseria animaloris]|nr:hypothetical protein BWD08_04675 [Neisseria animaloris]